MTPLIGAALEQAGYDRHYSLKVGEISEVPMLDAVVGWDGGRVIETSEPVTLDVGAAGKGYAVDLIGDIMESHGIVTYVIDASGDIRCRGGEETVGLEHPFDPNK